MSTDPVRGLRDVFRDTKAPETAPALTPGSRARRPPMKPAMQSRTSLSLGVHLLDRVGLARTEHRWSLIDLLRHAVGSPPTPEQAETNWRSNRGDRTAARGVQLPTDLADELDRLSKAWRMNRSQTARVLLHHALSTLRLDATS